MAMADGTDIANYFAELRKAASELAGADMPENERAQIKALAEIGLRLGECIINDLNRIAHALEQIEMNTRRQ